MQILTPSTNDVNTFCSKNEQKLSARQLALKLHKNRFLQRLLYSITHTCSLSDLSQCYKLQSSIADWVGCSVRTLRRGVKFLIENKLVECIGRRYKEFEIYRKGKKAVDRTKWTLIYKVTERGKVVLETQKAIYKAERAQARRLAKKAKKLSTNPVDENLIACEQFFLRVKNMSEYSGPIPYIDHDHVAKHTYVNKRAAICSIFEQLRDQIPKHRRNEHELSRLDSNYAAFNVPLVTIGLTSIEAKRITSAVRRLKCTYVDFLSSVVETYQSTKIIAVRSIGALLMNLLKKRVEARIVPHWKERGQRLPKHVFETIRHNERKKAEIEGQTGRTNGLHKIQQVAANLLLPGNRESFLKIEKETEQRGQIKSKYREAGERFAENYLGYKLGEAKDASQIKKFLSLVNEFVDKAIKKIGYSNIVVNFS